MTEPAKSPVRTYAAGEEIFRLGEPSENVFYIDSGRVSVALDYKGRRVTVDCGPGDMLGDSAFLFQQADPAEIPEYGGTATAVDAVSLVVIPRADLEAALENTPVLIRAWIASFVNRTLRLVHALAE